MSGGDLKIYSLSPISDSKSEILVLGTMRGEMLLKQNQYYGNEGNRIWKILYEIFNEPFSMDYDLRRSVALKNHSAVWDVLKACERKESSDAAIQNEETNEYKSFFSKHPHVKKIIFNGKKPRELFDKYVAGVELRISIHFLRPVVRILGSAMQINLFSGR